MFSIRFILNFLLFFLLTPGIILSLPAGKSIIKKTIVHGIIFVLLFYFIQCHFFDGKYREGYGGSYKYSCTDCRMLRSGLNCNCRKRNGTIQNSNIRVMECSNRENIRNEDGKLTC